MARGSTKSSCRAFTLVELLIVLTIITLLVGLLTPALAAAWRVAQDVKCRANLRTIGRAALNYAALYRGAFPPLCASKSDLEQYWWGVDADPPDFSSGTITPFLGLETGQEGSVFECPLQPGGSYVPEGGLTGPSTTYGYNGYYLCLAATPGWCCTASHPWQTTATVSNPASVFMFGDTLMVGLMGRGVVSNNCLLDPPWTFNGHSWSLNRSTTVCFRHDGHANFCFVDGHVDGLEPTTLLNAANMIGYVGTSNAPYYVPDYKTGPWTRLQ
jgi:prepilin-type N-terminal cleavage/methylation domain-containing protein/prepilin-type processing-associated H-X9-DG protein